MKARSSERMTMYIHDETGNAQICLNCKHFHRHYLKEGVPLPSGHCGHPRIKLRYAYDACDYFEK